jgi:hypothetical protein
VSHIWHHAERSTRFAINGQPSAAEIAAPALLPHLESGTIVVRPDPAAFTTFADWELRLPLLNIPRSRNACLPVGKAGPCYTTGLACRMR